MKNPKNNTNLKQDLFDMGFKRTICVDFDGVVHWYRQGWSEGAIYDEPVPGAFAWLTSMVEDEGFEVAIYSSRSKHPNGVEDMKRWFRHHALDEDVLFSFEFPTQKPAAWLTIDDRCFQFKGLFPTKEYLLGYTAWMSDNHGDGALHSDASVVRQVAEQGLYRFDETGREMLLRIADRMDGLK